MPQLTQPMRLSKKARRAIDEAFEANRDAFENILSRAQQAGDEYRYDLAAISDPALRRSVLRYFVTFPLETRDKMTHM